MRISGINSVKLFLYIFILALLGGIGVYAFLAGEIIKVDVSAPDPDGPVTAPENYKNLPVLDVIIPSYDGSSVDEDIKIHNGVASSNPRDRLIGFLSTNWYTDYNANGNFDGNIVSGDAEAIVISTDDLLDTSDTVEKTGLCQMKTFSIFSGIGEQYIDSNHSQSYTTGEAVVRTSVASGKVYPGEVVRGGAADLTLFNSGIRFTDGINGNVTPAQYNSGEAIILSNDGILDADDVVITPGNADLKPFPNNMAYTDSDGDTKYGNLEAILMDNGTTGKLDIGLLNGSGTDAIIRQGKANLKPMPGQGLLFADDNNDNIYSPYEMIVSSPNLSVEMGEVKLSGLANLKPVNGFSFADHNNDGQLDATELIIKNTGTGLDILENEDTVVSVGDASLREFTVDQEQFIDDNGNDIYDDGECIVYTNGIIKPEDIRRPGKALLQPFSGNNYLFTEYALDGKYTGDTDLADGYQGEAIFKDLNANDLIDNGELVTAGYADIKSIPPDVWYIDAGNPTPRNGIYENGEAIIESGDNILSNSDTIIRPGPAFLNVFNTDMKWADANDNNLYEGNELMVKSSDNTLSPGEIIKPGYCNLQSLASIYEGRLYSDNNQSNTYASDELLLYSTDAILDAGDVVSNPGKASLLSLKNQSYTWYIDTNGNKDFDSQESIIYDSGADPTLSEAVLDITDSVVRTSPGAVDIKSFGDEIVYIDQNGDGYFKGDSDNDVTWDEGSDYANNLNVIYDQDEVMLNDPLGQEHLSLDSGDAILRPGLALMAAFPDQVTYTDDGNNGFDGDTTNEAVIYDADANLILDTTDVILVTGRALIGDFDPPRVEKYIDANMDGAFTAGEAMFVDSGPGGVPNGLLDAGPLDGTGIDQVTHAGLAKLKKFQRTEKFVDGNRNGAYDTGEAIVYDWYAPSTFAGEYILAGYISLTYQSGSLAYKAPGSRTGDMILLASNPNQAEMVQMNHRPQHKYIDKNHSNTYDDFYVAVYEPIIWSENNNLDEGNLDTTGIDNVLASGYSGARRWPDNLKWSDSNHDGKYQKNEAIIYDAGNNNIISSIGSPPSNDQVRVAGEADLKGFEDMKYVDANYSGDYNNGELMVNDANQDDMIQSQEISEPGLVPADLLLPFSTSDYKYCDSDGDGEFNPQEAIILDLAVSGILEATDEIVSPGYAGFTAFNPANMMIDTNHNAIYDGNEGIIYGNGDQVLNGSDQIIIPGIASSFDDAKFKYTAEVAGGLYNDGWLITNDADDNNIVTRDEIVTSGLARLRNFSLSTDRYSDSNHNNAYDYDNSAGFGEAIIVNTTGNLDKVEETDQIKTPGYADLNSFDGTAYKYSDSDRNNDYNDGELIANDLDANNKVDNGEIKRPGLAGLKGFSADVTYSDDNRDDLYASSEAVVRSADADLGSNDEVLASGAAGLKIFGTDTYRFADANHNSIYNADEAIIVESGWGAVDNVLEESDIVLLSGLADIEQFTSDFMFLDDNANSNNYEDGEAIVYDSNNDNLLEPGEIITGGRAALWKFGTGERYIDGGQGENSQNGRYDQDEVIIRDGNSNGNLDFGALNGTGTDNVLASGKAGLRQFRDDECYVDKNGNGKYDGGQYTSEDIYIDKDNNGIVTMGDDALEYFVVANNGSATKSDLSAVKLWADKDKDGQFEPDTDDAPFLALLVSDPSNPKLWYEGPAVSPPLSSPSSRLNINYNINGNNQRFFVTVDTSGNPTDGRNIQMSLPVKGVKTIFGPASPTDAGITNAYSQKIDFANPNLAEITSPAPGTIINGLVTLKANAADTIQIGKVEFYKGTPGGGNTPIAVDDNGPPWESVWNSNSLPYGSYTLYARAYDKTYLRPSQTPVIPHYKDSQGVPITIAETTSVGLTTGWNFISVPVESFNANINSVLLPINGKFTEVWAYNSITLKWQRYDLGGPSFLNDLGEIHAGKGYWLLMSAPGTLTINGAKNSDGIQLQMGWNLVGCKSLVPVDVVQAMSSLTGDISVWTYNIATDNWLNYDPQEAVKEFNYIEPGKAYWIYTENGGTWILP